MKATLVSMVIGLIAIVGITFYLHGGSLPPHPASAPPTPFSLSSDPASPENTPLIQAPLLQEAFQGQQQGQGRDIVSVSDTAYDAMTVKQRSDFLRQIQQAVRDEVLASRQMERPGHDGGEECASDASLSEHHGRDYQKRCESTYGKEEEEEEAGSEEQKEKRERYRCPKNPDGSCPPVPDMTQYIRKDQIPCWGCSVDY